VFLFFAYFYLVSRKDYVSVTIVIIDFIKVVLYGDRTVRDGLIFLFVRAFKLDGLLIEQPSVE